MALIYEDISKYQKELETLKLKSKNFELMETGSSKKIIYENGNKILYTKLEDKIFGELNLISMVRRDGLDFIKKNDDFKVLDIDFFGLIEKIDKKIKVSKIDIKSAYWETAIKLGIISDKTLKKYNEVCKKLTDKEIKRLRLKVLGSLATSKIHKKYKNGKINKSVVYRSTTRELYMYICDCVDTMMKKISMMNDGCVYYYWDCLFVKEGKENDICKAIKEMGYEYSITNDTIEVINVCGVDYIISINENKIYTANKNKDDY